MATTTNFGWETPDDTDLVKDGALAMRTLGNAIDTSLVDLKGGTTGQVLSKTSNTDMDFTWVTSDDANAIQNAIVDAKGDLITATAADTPARLAVGTNGQVLTADSTTATGLKWAAASGGLPNATSYTPTFTNFTWNNGTCDAAYVESGDSVYYYGRITLGSTSSVTGGIRISPPVNINTTYWGSVVPFQGFANVVDVSAGNVSYPSYIWGLSTSLLGFYVKNSSGTYLSVDAVNATVPVTLATGDILSWALWYRKA